MDFNNYMSSMGNAQNDMVYTQLQTLYLENEALLQYFECVNKQFQSWLNAQPFNSTAMSAILPKLEPIFSNLASLKFSLMDMEEDEIAPQISTKYERLKRNITLLMTYQEVSLYQSRIEQLLEQNDTFKVENLKKVEQAQIEKQAQAEREERERQQRALALEREKQAQREREAQQLQQQAREKQAQREREAQQLQQQAREKQAQAEREERERQQRALALEREKQAQREREAQQLQQKERERQTLQELRVIFEDNKVLLSEFKGVSAQFERLLNPANTVYSLVEELVKQHRKIVSELQVLKLLLFEIQRLEISEAIKPKWSFLQKDTYASMTWQQIPTITEQWRKIAAENQTLREVAQQTIKKALTKTFLEEPEMVFIQHPNSSFAIGKFPITQREWIAIMGTNPSEFKGDRLPIGKVTWYDANQYITQLNQKTGKNYRLPTSNEWLYAAKGGQDYLYGSTNNLAEVAWYFLNSNQTVHPVGTKNPNGYGLYDTLGNVFEWCQNQWLYSPTNQLLAIIAGGNYNCNPDSCNLNLSGFPPEKTSEGFGFRVCMPLS